ncbi:hypothetical protein [Allorhizocola rhizosphaerae]|uniref:hypothetical protein n=1 Tax=Allorhizocola rhizosphaerae TaxID=1872709 RepID=UPI000E3C9721|nr:hypothetical protein [Allorhizocola rhizosphaerae]
MRRFRSNLFLSAPAVARATRAGALAAAVIALIVTATAAPASAAPLTRTSANGCARASLNYDYIAQAGGTYYIYVSGNLHWNETAGCGLFRNPYAGALLSMVGQGASAEHNPDRC